MIRDIRGQAEIPDKKRALERLKGGKLDPIFSAGVWFFFPGRIRFHEAYIERGGIKDTLQIISEMYDEGLVNRSFGVEVHYPSEINSDNIDLYRRLQKETGVKVATVVPNLFYERDFELGSLSNPNPEKRKKAVDRTIEALKLNRELDTEFMVIWPGIDGYENPLGHDFYGMWERFESGLAHMMDEVPGVRVAIEPKPYEPRGNNIYRNTANGLLMARNVEKRLENPENRKLLEKGHALVTLNPEVGHVLMGHEDLAYSIASILREGRLAHMHWNSQPLGNYDQDLNVGVLSLSEALSTIVVLKLHGYGGKFGIDINPERMPVKRALILNMNSIRTLCEIVDSMDAESLVEAMYDPERNRGVAEDVLTRAISKNPRSLLPLK
ncbi:MAG: TIM barrel protein [Nitrososphaeria archaeon]